MIGSTLVREMQHTHTVESLEALTMKDELLTIGPAAKRAGISPGWLRLLSDMGKVPHTRTGQIRLYKASDMDKLKAERAKRKKGDARG